MKLAKMKALVRASDQRITRSKRLVPKTSSAIVVRLKATKSLV